MGLGDQRAEMAWPAIVGMRHFPTVRRITLFSILFVLALAVGLPALGESELPPGGTFVDDDGSVHEAAIEALVVGGITQGCDERGIYFCADRAVTRGEMAAFLTRALLIPAASSDSFVDDSNSVFEGAINAIAAAGITKGCNPPVNDRFCADDPVSREQMATFLVRALQLDAATTSSGFTDVAGSVHVPAIDAIAAADITRGCNPPDNTEFCPRQPVTRAQMATFLTRALPDLTPIQPPARTIERISRFTTYHDCCEARVTNIQVMADALDGYVVMPGEIFSINEILGPRTADKGYVPAGYLQNGKSACCVIGGGTSQFGTTIYNAIFWGGFEDIYHKPHSRYIDRYPVGIEATMGYPTLDVKFRNDTDTIVIVKTSHTASSITVELWGDADGWMVSGYHPRGAQRSVIDVISNKGRRVSGSVSGSASYSGGGSARVTRTITEADGTKNTQTWYWRYLSSGDVDGYLSLNGSELVED